MVFVAKNGLKSDLRVYNFIVGPRMDEQVFLTKFVLPIVFTKVAGSSCAKAFTERLPGLQHFLNRSSTDVNGLSLNLGFNWNLAAPKLQLCRGEN